MKARDRLQFNLHRTIHPLVKLFISIGLTPNGVPTPGLILNLSVAIIFIIGAEYGKQGYLSSVGWSGAMILFAGFIALMGSIRVSYTRAQAEGQRIPCKDGLMQRPERVVMIGVSAILCSIISASAREDHKWMFPRIEKSFESIAFFTLPLSIVAIPANYTAIQRLKACHLYMTEQDKNAKPS